MDKVAIVVQRYSIDVNGGAEMHARMLAEHLNEKYEIEVLTTCAKDYITWENYYQEGEERVNGIKVMRFSSLKKDMKRNGKLSHYLRRNLRYSKGKITWKNFFILPVKKALYKKKINHSHLFDEWIEAQGPLCPSLVDYIKEKKDNYAAFIFFTYLYYPTYIGIQQVGDKSILIPTAHDETPFYFSDFKKLFSHPKFIMYNTLSEKELVERTYPQSKQIRSDIAGVGFDKPDYALSTNPLNTRYFLYIGRIDKNKGCKELIEYFNDYKKKVKDDVKLVLVGNNFMKKLKISKDIILTGFVSDEEKSRYLQYSEALIIPSRFESLSMVTLEAMIMGKPVLATSKSEVLEKHIETSGAGFTYSNKNDFISCLNRILTLSDDKKIVIAQNGIRYVEENYNWTTIVDKFTKAIDYIDGK
ncbi:MAG: glycosyltransferase family 4 protein [Prevotella sp.]|jgi:glycosyltransferase involved in cell wall biosynthesis|nr:glycosyltransferase family 4 protein [Prevotella sp.]